MLDWVEGTEEISDCESSDDEDEVVNNGGVASRANDNDNGDHDQRYDNIHNNCISRGAQSARSHDDSSIGRLEGLTAVVEDWHARLTLMRVCL